MILDTECLIQDARYFIKDVGWVKTRCFDVGFRSSTQPTVIPAQAGIQKDDGVGKPYFVYREANKKME